MKRDLIASIVLRVCSCLFATGFVIIVVKASIGQLLTTDAGEPSLSITALAAFGALVSAIATWFAGKGWRERYNMSFNNAKHQDH